MSCRIVCPCGECPRDPRLWVPECQRLRGIAPTSGFYNDGRGDFQAPCEVPGCTNNASFVHEDTGAARCERHASVGGAA